MQRPQGEPITLNDLLITEELSRRVPRSPNWQAEAQAMQALARQMARGSESLMQILVEIALELCQAGTAGISVLETAPNGEEVFRWAVLAGTLAQYCGGTTPRTFSPCGVCLERGTPQLFSKPERYFTYFQAVNLPIVEGLVLPLIAEDHVLGTLWIMSHTEQRHFDSEDVRVMTSLADFPATALLWHQRQIQQLQAVNARLQAEIAERKRTEEIAQEREAYFRAIANLVPDLLWRNNTTGDITWSNQRWLDYTGQTLEEAQGYGWLEVIHPDDRAQSLANFQKAVDERRLLRHEHRIRGQDGNYRWFLLQTYPVIDADGRITQCFGAATDIHEQRTAIEQSRESEHRLQVMIENLPGGAVFVVDRNLRYVLAAGEALWAAGFRPQDLVGKTIFEGLSPDLAANYQAMYCRALAGEPFEHEHNAHDRWYISRGTPLHSANGEVYAVLAISYDITERKKVEETLRDSEQRLSVIFAQAAVGLSEISLDGHFQQVNDALCRMLGRSRSELLATTVFEVTHPDDVPKSLQALERLLETGEPISLDKQYLHLDGTVLWANSILTRLNDAQGQPRCILAVTFDLSDRKQAEAERLQRIQQQNAHEKERQRAEALAELDRTKTRFFSNVSHEFRTPLTLLLAPLQDALSDRINPLPLPQRERLELAQRHGLRLLKLVNTLLDFSRIEAGRMAAFYEPTDLATFTAELASVFQSAIERAGLRLIVDCPPLPQPVYVDCEMWEKIVLNLLSNALKFTFEGEIAVRLHPADSHQIRLEIQDTGTGIAPEHLPHLFERFYQVRGTQARTYEGSGIGLALIHELIRLHGGTIEVSSTLGQGTCFKIAIPFGTEHLPSEHLRPDKAERIPTHPTLPSTALSPALYVSEAEHWLPKADVELPILDLGLNTTDTDSPPHNLPQQTADPKSQIPNPKSKILLVDDNADMRHYLTRILSEHAQVEAVADGAAALVAAQTQVPDLVLTDVMMPRLDGFQLLQTLRADPRTKAVPILLLSACAGEEAIIEGLEAGADDYLIKPFSAQELISRVNAHLQMAQLRGEALHQARMTIGKHNELLSTVSHELNTPLVAILGWTRLLRGSPPTPSMLAKALETIERNATLQAKLVQDLLDMTRMTAGKLRLSLQPLKLESVIETAIATVAQTAEAKSIELVWHNTKVASADSPMVMGDRERLQQVMYNLLTNAIKFTPETGKITIELSVSSVDNHLNNSYAEIRVMDTGIGIPAEFLPHVFERFGQAKAQDAAKGLGLGLAIAQHLVELHNGIIQAQSPGEGQGAAFIVLLPLLIP